MDTILADDLPCNLADKSNTPVTPSTTPFAVGSVPWPLDLEQWEPDPGPHFAAPPGQASGEISLAERQFWGQYRPSDYGRIPREARAVAPWWVRFHTLDWVRSQGKQLAAALRTAADHAAGEGKILAAHETVDRLDAKRLEGFKATLTEFTGQIELFPPVHPKCVEGTKVVGVKAGSTIVARMRCRCVTCPSCGPAILHRNAMTAWVATDLTVHYLTEISETQFSEGYCRRVGFEHARGFTWPIEGGRRLVLSTVDLDGQGAIVEPWDLGPAISDCVAKYGNAAASGMVGGKRMSVFGKTYRNRCKAIRAAEQSMAERRSEASEYEWLGVAAPSITFGNFEDLANRYDGKAKLRLSTDSEAWEITGQTEIDQQMVIDRIGLRLWCELGDDGSEYRSPAYADEDPF